MYICHFVVTFTKRIRNYQKKIECQIKDLSIQKGNSIYIPYVLHFQVTCLHILDSRRRDLGFFISERE